MDIVDFFPKMYRDIDKQDNPAYSDKECFMVVREANYALVLHIIPSQTPPVKQIAMFWDHEKALKYCNLLAKDCETSL